MHMAKDRSHTLSEPWLSTLNGNNAYFKNSYDFNFEKLVAQRVDIH